MKRFLTCRPQSKRLKAQSAGSRTKNPKDLPSQALDVLKWTFLAKRPLTVIELRHALSVTIDFSKMQLEYDETLDWDNLPSEKSLIHWCLGLVTIDEKTSTVRLVHKSLHTYLTLLHEKGEIFPNGHSEIAYTCLEYMFFNDDKHEVDPSERIVTSRIKDIGIMYTHSLPPTFCTSHALRLLQCLLIDIAHCTLHIAHRTSQPAVPLHNGGYKHLTRKH
jgi:hypothetical protein